VLPDVDPDLLRKMRPDILRIKGLRSNLAQSEINYITLQDFNVHGANTTHGTESEVFRGVKREENPQYIELLRRISTVSVLRAAQ
jgi:hypothetical protein